MQIKLDIDPKYKDAKVSITAPCMTDEIGQTLNIGSKGSVVSLVAKKNDKIVLVKIDDIYRIYAESGFWL